MNEKQLAALVNYPYPLIQSLRMGANDVRARFDAEKADTVTNTENAVRAVRATAEARKVELTREAEAAVHALRNSAARAKSELQQRAAKALWEMRQEYAQQVKEADRILAGEQEPYGIDHSMNQIL